MKHIYQLCLLVALCTVSASAQEFEVDQANKRIFFDGTQGARVYFNEVIRQNSPYVPEHWSFEIADEEGAEIVKFDNENGGRLTLREFEGDFVSELGTGGVKLFENNVMQYDFSQQNGFRAYDNLGNVSVQIRGDISGDGRVSTNELEITGGSDLSEHFNIIGDRKNILPGMLVAIAEKDGTLKIADQVRDKKVVGIISGANGIETGLFMGQKGSIADGDYPIALTGRTYVMATTENGPIEVGDFITSSSRAGFGMKVRKHKKAQGAIIGKALTSLTEGQHEGYVLVLITLQ